MGMRGPYSPRNFRPERYLTVHHGRNRPTPFSTETGEASSLKARVVGAIGWEGSEKRPR